VSPDMAIVSTGHSSPEGFWYDESDNEWGTVPQGAAHIQFEREVIEMLPGDYLDTPPTISTGWSGQHPTHLLSC